MSTEKEKKIKYNHNRPLSDFKEQLDLIIESGFKPIAVSQLFFEDTFVFETNQEAEEAFKTLEYRIDNTQNSKVVGWWYGKEDFKKTVEEYEKNNYGFSKVLVHWF